MNQQGELKRIKLADIVPSASNPRKNFNTPDWPEFVANIKANGVIQPGVVRAIKWELRQAGVALGHRITRNGVDYKEFKKSAASEAAAEFDKIKNSVELVAGERRYRASKEAGLPDMPVMVMELSDERVIELQQIENLQREDLSPLEEARGYAEWRDSLIKSGAAKTVEEAVAHICGKINRKRSAVFQRLALLKICPAAKKAVESGELNASMAGLLAQIPDPAAQQKCMKEFGGDKWNPPMSFRAAQQHIADDYRVNLSGAPFKWDEVFAAPKDCTAARTPDHKLLICSKCPLNTSNMVDQYPELKSTPNVCTDPVCFRAKVQLHTDATLKKALADGHRVLAPELYNRARHDFNTPDEKCWDDSKYRTYAQLAKAAKVEPMLTVNAEGLVVKVFSRDDVTKIRSANKIRSSSGMAGKQDRDKLKRKKESSVVAGAATAQILKVFVTDKGVDDRLWQLLSDNVAHLIGIERESFIAKRRGLAKVQHEVRDGLEGWLTGTPAARRTNRELQEFIVEALLCSTAVNYDGRIGSEFKDLCKLARLDLDKTEKAIKEWGDMPHTGYGETIAAATKLTPEIQKIINDFDPDDARILQEVQKKPGGLAPDVWTAVQKRWKELLKLDKQILRWADGKTDKHPLEDKLNPEIKTKKRAGKKGSKKK